MATINYKEKYEKAVHAAMLAKQDTESAVTIRILEEIFPELKESEDERIRREIIAHIKWCEDGGYCAKEEMTRWISWLEKQGEHANFRNKIQIGDKVTRNKDGVLVNLSQLNRVAKKDEKQGENFPILSNSSNIGKDEQKPVGWSEEDERMFESALWHIKNSCGNQGKNSGEFEVYNWLESLKGRVQLQTKQEWSEEDDSHLLRIIWFLRQNYKRESQYKEEICSHINWLKSLRPQNKWKPSDEQMNNK